MSRKRADELKASGRDAYMSAAMDGIDDEIDAEPAAIFEMAAAAVDELIDRTLVFPAERWDEDCHNCEAPIRDHFVDGRCPARSLNDELDANRLGPNPNPGESTPEDFEITTLPQED